ncbi:MAG TPA: hypothetical protein DCO93_05665 [Clostridiales bacterium]|nr:hypothetical protein [Clostridiales bacterium]
MKKIIRILISLCIVLSSIDVLAEGNVSVTVNGVLLDFDQPPIIENGRTLVPMRAIFEALGCTVEYWDGEEKTVFAEKGFDTISLVIGENTMLLNGETEITLDVPARIENSGTFIPLRAVSNALGANVEWNDADKAVIIESRQGAHKIEKKLITEKIENKFDFEANVYYPFIESNGNEFIDKINEEYESNAKVSIAEALDFYNECLEEEYSNDYEIPFTLDVDYNITMDRNGYISIVTTYATYTGGAHPNSTMDGRTFDLRDNKELTLREVFNEETFDLENAVAERIADKVAEYSDDEEHIRSVHDSAIEDIDNAGFYLTDNMVHVFYVPYQIASYAEGYLTADIYYDSEYINVNLSDYDWPELVYEIPGNRTTGFEWTLVQDSDKLDIELNYIEPETNLPGTGGVYELRVKGVRPGNANIRLEYKRDFEESPIETLEYSFYVENDLGVTLINKKQS